MPRLLCPLLLVLILLPLAACTASEEPDTPEPAPRSTAAEESPTAEPVPTKAILGRVVGRLPPPRRRQLVRKVTPVVDGWLDAAYVGGEFPREVDDAWPGFTRDAARRARQDRRLTSVAGLAEQIDGVEVVRRAVRYNVLAVDRRPVGVTARLTLDFRTSGAKERTVSLRGRVALTRVRGDWKIFAYDVTRGLR